MGWLFGSRGKIDDIEKTEVKVEHTLKTLWGNLQGKSPAKKKCPFCNSLNAAEAGVCWNCKNVLS
jgi:hypothetical protein